MPRVIINADDFGLTLGVNRAIEELHQAGVLTSTTLMANGAEVEDAIAVGIRNPILGVGCHVVLVDGAPISPPDAIGSLLEGGGSGRPRFRRSLADFVRDLYLARIRREDIRREATAQVRKLLDAGINITHLDTHKHTHMFPAVQRELLRVADEHSIGAVRVPFEASWATPANSDSPLKRRLQMALLGTLRSRWLRLANTRPSIFHADASFGITSTGELDGRILQHLLEAIPRAERTWELVCHPGYHDDALGRSNTRLLQHRDVEREALLAEIPSFLKNRPDISLIHYGQAGGAEPAREEHASVLRGRTSETEHRDSE